MRQIYILITKQANNVSAHVFVDFVTPFTRKSPNGKWNNLSSVKVENRCLGAINEFTATLLNISDVLNGRNRRIVNRLVVLQLSLIKESDIQHRKFKFVLTFDWGTKSRLAIMYLHTVITIVTHCANIWFYPKFLECICIGFI